MMTVFVEEDLADSDETVENSIRVKNKQIKLLTLFNNFVQQLYLQSVFAEMGREVGAREVHGGWRVDVK